MPEDRDAAHAKDHAGIDGLLDGLVPALVAKLGTLNVGELEIRQDDWRVRLQRPPGAGPGYGRRVSDRTGQRSHPGHDGLGSAAVRASGPQPATAPGGASGNGTGPSLAAVGPGRAGEAAAGHAPADHAPVHGPIATSPAVGVFQPGPKAVGGTRVRAGDRLGIVDMLGVPQDVNAPADGIVVGVIVEAGTAVEYGQELVHIEAAGPVEAR